MTHDLPWRKSTFSPSNQCVEVADAGDHVALRNSNHPDAGTLRVGRPAFAGLIADVKAGRLDDLAG